MAVLISNPEAPADGKSSPPHNPMFVRLFGEINMRLTKIICGPLFFSTVLVSTSAFAVNMDAHAHHHHPMSTESSQAVVDYSLPKVNLVRQDGKTVPLADELNDGRPVILNFIYTTCTTVCPLTSQTFSQLQTALGSDKYKVHLVSISIDPEEDTPARLQKYAQKFGADSEWNHYTGSVEASIATQRAFDVYRGDKMNHNPVTLLRSAPGKPWLRIDGFSSAADLLNAYRNLVAVK
ncbi:SCO family protein [Glaciimonas sp. CA11.2]|nr:SCO family protein [Glaciimonas sp. CA11.2]MDY7545088.1 SCO family protein [Glaciimonas sp. CA11.2]MEB0161991.1 SCO family protein [Glaciimonas sp. CA11.2]